MTPPAVRPVEFYQRLGQQGYVFSQIAFFEVIPGKLFIGIDQPQSVPFDSSSPSEYAHGHLVFDMIGMCGDVCARMDTVT